MIDVISGKVSMGAINNLLEYLKQIRAEGRLKLEHNDQVGQIYLEEGMVIHSVWRDQVGQAALQELLSWQEGRFEFEPDVLSPVHSIVSEMAPLSTGSTGAVVSSRSSGDVTSGRDLMVVEPHIPAASFAAEAPQASSAVLPVTLPEELLEELELVVKRLMGPIGGIFLDDAVEDLGYADIEAIPTEYAQDLMQTIADYFDDDSRRRQFLQAAKELLRHHSIEENEK